VNVVRWPVSAAGDRYAVWHSRAEDKDELYVSTKGLILLSAVTTPTFTPGRVSTLFEMTAYTASNQANTNRRMAVSPDGQRFLFLKTAATQAGPGQDSQRVLFVENWIEELKQRVPVD
jgi:hypothetical protein